MPILVGFVALLAGVAIGAVASLAYTIPQHKDGEPSEPERLSPRDE